MIVSITAILLCQLCGEAIQRGTGLPVPGPVIGLTLLLGLLALRDHAPRAVPVEVRDGTLETTGRGLLAHLSLLFIPAGVGVVQRLDVFVTHGLGLAVALVVSTLVALLLTVATFRLVARWAANPSDAPEEEA